MRQWGCTARGRSATPGKWKHGSFIQRHLLNDMLHEFGAAIEFLYSTSSMPFCRTSAEWINFAESAMELQ
jgi:hypothetical protein